jgi:hypothetical protein
MRRTTAIHEARFLRRRGLYFGTDASDTQSLYVQWQWLRTHLHTLGPTGQGKSRLLLWLFELLCATGRPIILVDFKGGLYQMARNYALAHGLTKRLALFDLSANRAPGYNPLRENGLRLDLQAQWVAEGVKSAWGQATFDATPQLARILYLCLYVARALTISLVEGLDVLRPSPTLRAQALVRIKDPFVRGALLAFDQLNDRRKEELAASTLARLEAFCRDAIVRTVICSEQSLDLETVPADRRILLINFAKYQPLLPDPLKLLARLFTSDLLAHVYKGHGEGKFDENNPVYFLCDEVQNMATRQLCDALDEGRGIGLHCILAHQHLAQLALEDQSGYLLKSVMNDARTKIIFGDLDYDDLEALAKNVMLDQYSPWPTKDQIGKTARLITTASRSHSRGRGMSWPVSETEGESASESTGTNRSITNGVEESESEARTIGKSHGRSHTDSHGHTTTQGTAHTDNQSHARTTMDSQSRMHGQGDMQGTMDASGSGAMTAQSAGVALSYDNPYMAVFPDAMTIARTRISSTSSHHSHATHAATNSFTAEGASHGEADTESYGEADTVSESEADTLSFSTGTSEVDTESFTTGRTTGKSFAIREGASDSITRGTNRSITQGVTPSMSEEHGSSASYSIQALTPEEQTLLSIQAMKAIPIAHFLLKVPGKPALIVRAPWVEEPKITKKTLEAGLERVYALPYYTYIEALDDGAHEQSAPMYRALPTPPEPDEDEDMDCWRTERPTL